MPVTQPGVGIAFSAPFREQIAFFGAKVNLPSRRWDDIKRSAHDRGFIVAGAMKADLLADLRAAVEAAINDGEGIQAFRDRFDEIVDRHGWHGWTGEGTQAGRDWRTRVVYQTNLQTSWAAGRYKQLTDPDLLKLRPWWLYIHDDSVNHPRPLHQEWGDIKLTLRHDDPFWQTHYPPNGWGCRCRVKAVRAPEGDAATEPPAGWDQLDAKTGAPVGIDKGWDYAPGASVANLADQVRAKAADLPAAIGQALLDAVADVAVNRLLP